MAKHPMSDALDEAEAYLKKRQRERRLADAAPDLLAALKLCLPLMKAEWGNYGPQEPEGHAIRVARAAIAKAEPS
jgi:hypothetical protein